MTEWIKINGEDLPFSFNYSAIKYLIANTKEKNFVDILQSMEYYDKVLFAGLVQGARLEKTTFKLKVSDCEEFLNQDFSLLNELALLIQKCMIPKTEVDNIGVADTEKKISELPST